MGFDNSCNSGTPGNSPGSTGILGDYTMNAASTLAIEIGGTTPATEHDQVAVAAQANVDGTLNLSLFNGYVPNAYDSFEDYDAINILPAMY